MSILKIASLVVTPNAYEESKLLAVVPSNGSGDLDFVRASTKTRVNSEGFISDTCKNLLSYSNNLNLSNWTLGQATRTPVSIDNPFSLTTVALVESNQSLQTHSIGSVNPVIAGTVYNYSIFCKKGISSFIQLGNGSAGFGNSFFCNFNLENGTIGNFGTETFNTKIETFPNGWYRCSYSAIALNSVTAINACFLVLITSLTSARAESNSTPLSVYMGGAQLTVGQLPQEYFPTTDRLNIPSIDYTDGGCPSILLEPQRTNLNTYSDDIGDTSYAKIGLNVSGTPPYLNQIVAPDNTVTADLMIEDGTTGTHRLSKGVAVVNSTTYTASFFVKKLNRSKTRLNIFGSFVNFDLNTASIISSNGTIIASGIESYANSWFRCFITVQANSTTGTPIIYALDDAGNVSYTGTNIGSIYVWGIQVEESSYLTSYIPTQANAVTRLQDQLIKTGISSLIGQTEGVFFIESSALVTNDLIRAVTLTDGTTNNRIQIRYEGSNNSIFFVFQSNGGFVTVLTRTVVDVTQFLKIAIRYSANEVSIFIDGVKVTTNNTIVLPLNLNKLSFDNGTGALQFNAKVNSLLLFKTYLSDDEMQLLGTTSYNTYQEMATALNYVTQ
jgi:hypothetical protein